jgi:hypothetical protein
MAFVETVGSYYADDSLTMDEILGIFRYLGDRDLAEHAGAGDATAVLIKARVTDTGADCALRRAP